MNSQITSAATGLVTPRKEQLVDLITDEEDAGFEELINDTIQLRATDGWELASITPVPDEETFFALLLFQREARS